MNEKVSLRALVEAIDEDLSATTREGKQISAVTHPQYGELLRWKRFAKRHGISVSRLIRDSTNAVVDAVEGKKRPDKLDVYREAMRLKHAGKLAWKEEDESL